MTKKTIKDYLDKEERQNTTIRAPKSLWDRVRKLAAQEGCSVNALIVAAIKKLCDDGRV